MTTIHTTERMKWEKALGRFRWMVDPERGRLLPLAGLWILALDWLLFSSNVASAGLATPIIVVLGFLLGGAGTWFLQRRIAGDRLWKAAVKAFAAGVAVGLPWPLAGTLIGGWVLLAAGINKPNRDMFRR